MQGLASHAGGRPAAPQQLTSLRAYWQQRSVAITSYLGVRRAGLRTSAQATEVGAGPAASSAAAAGVAADVYFGCGDQRPVILYDGVCNLCNGGVNFMLDWDKAGMFRLAALQSPAGRALLQRSGRSPDDISSIVLVTKERSYIKSEAVLRIAQGLNMPLPLLAGLAFLVPRLPADFLYDQVANNRYNLFGYTPSCRLSDDRFADRFIAE